jgi:hypothetical protein
LQTNSRGGQIEDNSRCWYDDKTSRCTLRSTSISTAGQYRCLTRGMAALSAPPFHFPPSPPCLPHFDHSRGGCQSHSAVRVANSDIEIDVSFRPARDWCLCGGVEIADLLVLSLLPCHPLAPLPPPCTSLFLDEDLHQERRYWIA